MTGAGVAGWVKKNQKLLLAGAALCCLLLFLFPGDPEKETDVFLPETDLRAETAEYEQQIKAELGRLLGECRGVGRAELFLTFESGVSYDYLKEADQSTSLRDTDESRDYSERYLFVEDAAGNKRVLAVKRILPRVRGAAVICEGGADPLVKRQVIELLRCVLDIPAGSISVSPLG